MHLAQISPHYYLSSDHHMVRPPAVMIRQYEEPDPGGESPNEEIKQVESRVHHEYYDVRHAVRTTE
jgi:hypothetical protein